MNETTGSRTIPNSFTISSRPLGDVTSPITADESNIKAGDIILSRAHTLTMHSIIALGQIYKYRWDKENMFRFWTHPAMIVAVKGRQIVSRDGTQIALVKETALVQATVNPPGVNFALLNDFRRDYSSRLWVFSTRKFDVGDNRTEAVREAEIEANQDVFEWLKGKDLLDRIEVHATAASADFRPRPASQRQVKYGMLSLASILVSQLFPKWKFRFFNEGQVTCSGFIAELMERAEYSFDSEIHAFPADVAQKLYDELGVQPQESEESWTGGVARLRQQISADRKVSLEGAKRLKLSGRAWALLAFGVAIAISTMVFFFCHISHLSWPVWIVVAALVAYFSIVAAPILVYSFLAYVKLAFVGIPRLVKMLRPLYWRKPGDMS